jgi:hypothetical protein
MSVTPTQEEHDDDLPADGVWHVVPVDDIRQHICDKDQHCWCNPVYDAEHDIYVHNSADGREAYEDGLRKPH